MVLRREFFSILAVLALTSLLQPDMARASNCDLNGDRCKATPLSQAEIVKIKYLRDMVAEKLVSIEAKEKEAGREFKIAIIARMGSDLSSFQPLLEKNSSGNLLTTTELIKKITTSSAAIPNPLVQNGSVSSKVLNQPFIDKARHLKYSHIGIAVKNLVVKGSRGQTLTSPQDGEWAVFQLLYSCEDDHKSFVFESALTYFFTDHMYDYGAQIIVPNQDLQHSIEDILLNKKIKNNFLQKNYNAAALPYSKTEQNSNQWVLETIAAGLAAPGAVTDRAQAQAVLQQTGYFGTRLTPLGMYGFIEVPLVQKVISNIMPMMCFSSQPTIKTNGIAEIVTALSVEEYLKRVKQVMTVEEVMVSAADKRFINESLAPAKKNGGTHIPTNPLGQK